MMPTSTDQSPASKRSRSGTSPSSKDESEEIRCPVKHCKIPIDLTIQTSHGLKLGAHRRNLELYSEGFPPSDIGFTDDDSQILVLSEDFATLSLLMQFCHKQKYPRLTDLSNESLLRLGEAAEKYIVDNAIVVCRAIIESRATIIPIEAMVYGVKHNYPYIADIAAPLTIHHPLSTIEKMSKSHPIVLLSWLRYRECFIPAINIAVTPPPLIPVKGQNHICSGGIRYVENTIADLPREIESLFGTVKDRKLPGMAHFADAHSIVLNYDTCDFLPICQSRMEGWRESIKSALDAVPRFSEIMSKMS